MLVVQCGLPVGYIMVHSFFRPVWCAALRQRSILSVLGLILGAQRTRLVARRLLNCWQYRVRLGRFGSGTTGILMLRFPVRSCKTRQEDDVCEKHVARLLNLSRLIKKSIWQKNSHLGNFTDSLKLRCEYLPFSQLVFLVASCSLQFVVSY